MEEDNFLCEKIYRLRSRILAYVCFSFNHKLILPTNNGKYFTK